MTLAIEAEWERLDAGPPEERACFAAISIIVNERPLIVAEDAFVKRLRTSVHLSAYRLAEWFAWNWWRQRWEPHATSREWALAHRMTTIGGGYVWPNITVVADGERVVLVAKPTESRPAEPLRYLIDHIASLQADEFEQAVSDFIEQVRGQLRAEKVATTNLDAAWDDVCAERAEPATAKRRRLEALLGCDPDEGNEDLVERLVSDEAELGESAVREMAAMASEATGPLTATDLRQIAGAAGFDSNPGDAVRLRDGETNLPQKGEVPAWRRGYEAARLLRLQESLGAASISDKRLAEMSGVSSTILSDKKSDDALSFAIDESSDAGRVVLRSKWDTGRRFDLARLLGDRIAWNTGGKLLPATRAHTYRQKLQRAFAAEFLSPFEAVAAMLEDDYSTEKQEDAAEYFSVSPLTIRTLLVNHGLIKRDDLDYDFEAAAPA